MTDHLQKTAAAVVVLLIGLQMLGQAVDAVGQNSDLYLGRTGVTLVDGILGDDGLLFLVGHGIFHLSTYIWHGHRGRLVKCRVAAVSANRAHVMLCHYTILRRICKGWIGKFSKCSHLRWIAREMLLGHQENGFRCLHPQKGLDFPMEK